MMLTADEIPALPLWINGHAFLTMVQDFYQVVDATTGQTVRRVPLCGEDEVLEVVAASVTAAPAWAATPADERRRHLAAVAEILAQPRYAEHFAKLIVQESGKPQADAEAEVTATVAALQAPTASTARGVAALVADDSQPLAAYARLLADTLNAGAVAVLKPSPRAPSCAFALAELWTRAGGPAGVINLVQGDDAALSALAAHGDVQSFQCAGRAPWLAKLSTFLGDKPCHASATE